MTDLEDMTSQMRYYYRNKEKINAQQREYNKQYYAKNKDKIYNRQREHKKSKPDHDLDYFRNWRNNNRDKVNEYFKRYYNKN